MDNANSSYEGVATSWLYNCIVGGTVEVAGNKISPYAELYNCRIWNAGEVTATLKDCTFGDPKFSENFTLQGDSPCIDAGEDSYVTLSTHDLAGNTRISGTHVDIGAYEYQPATYTINELVAKQRYPWNGLVDVTIDFTSSGASTAVGIALKVKNMEDSNETICNSFIVDGVATSSLSLVPGKRSFVWNAAADMPSGYNSMRMKLVVETK